MLSTFCVHGMVKKKSEEHTKLLQDRRASIDKRSELHDRALSCLYTGEGSYQQFEKSRQQTMMYLVFKSLQSYVQRELRQAAVREVSVSSK